MMLICLCGTLKGRPHAADCPYPEYGTADGLIDLWEDQHAAKVRAAVSRDVIAVHPSCADCGCRRFLCNEGCGRIICGCYHSCGRAS